MNPELLRDKRFWDMARLAVNAPHGHIPGIMADLADESDSPIRAHLLRHGVPEHQVAPRGAEVAQTTHPLRPDPHNPFPGWLWTEQHPSSRPGVIFPEEGALVHELRGTGSEGREPLARTNVGPESFELFRALPAHNYSLPGRLAVRYTLRLGKHHLRLVAPVEAHHIQALADALPRDPSGMGDNWDWHARHAEQTGHVDTPQPHIAPYPVEHPVAVHLARIRLQPGKLYGQPFGGGDPMIEHALHDEDTGKQVGVLRIQPRNDGRTLHVHWVGLSDASTEDDANRLGPRAVSEGMKQLGEHYPNAEFITGLRGTGFRGAANAERVMVPIKRKAKPEQLARQVYNRAPAGGGITGHIAQDGGEFLPKLHQRIRRVVAGLLEKATPLARGDANTRGTSLIGKPAPGQPYDQPLTLGQLKAIEDAHALPRAHRLSPKATQPTAATGDQHPYSVNIADAIQFAGHLSRSAIGPGRLKKLLADPKVGATDGEKHVHLVTQLLGDYEDAPHGAWYGDDVNVLDRLLHGRFGFGKLGPDQQLVGKGEPHEHHPGLVLFKTLVGATSPAQNPNDNMRSAVRMWAAGEKRNPHDPVAHIPLFQEDDLRDWLKRLADLHGVDHVPQPGNTSAEKAKWYADWVRSHEAAIGADEGRVGYSSLEHQVYFHPTNKEHPHHGMWFTDNKGNRNPAAPVPSKTRAILAHVKLPATNDAGIRPKGWSVYGKNIAIAITRLKRLVDRFRTPEGTPESAYRRAAEFLFRFHEPEEFSDAERKKVYRGGYYRPEERAPGFFLFGPKIGSFISNLHSNDPATRESHGAPFTHDTWMHRQLLRHLGRLTTDEKSKSPGSGDRAQIRNVIGELAKKLKLTPAELQADLWYYEQGLMRRLGVPGSRIPSLSFRGAAEKFLTPGSPHQLARTGLHDSLTTALGGRTWKRHSKQCAIQKHANGSISVFQHGKKMVTAHPDGTVQKHTGKFYKGRSNEAVHPEA